MALRGSTQSLALAATPSEHEAAFWACSGPWPAVCSKLARRFSYLETIPEELVLTILELCDMKELLACQSVRVQFVMNKHTCTHVPNNSIPHTDLPCSQGCDHKFREPTVQISPTRTRDVRRSTERAEQGREARVADRVRFRVGGDRFCQTRGSGVVCRAGLSARCLWQHLGLLQAHGSKQGSWTAPGTHGLSRAFCDKTDRTSTLGAHCPIRHNRHLHRCIARSAHLLFVRVADLA
jgi:hypothetical protein